MYIIMKRFIILACVIVSVYCNCGCLKCNPHLKLVSNEDSPVKIIIKGDKNIPHPPQKHTCPLVRQYYESLGYSSDSGLMVNKNHNVEVEVPIDFQINQGGNGESLVASPDRIIYPENTNNRCKKSQPMKSGFLEMFHDPEDELIRKKYLRYDYYIVPKRTKLSSEFDQNEVILNEAEPDATVRIRKDLTNYNLFNNYYELDHSNNNNNTEEEISMPQNDNFLFHYELQDSKSHKFSYLFTESINGDKQQSSVFYWNENEEPLRKLQSLLPPMNNPFTRRPSHDELIESWDGSNREEFSSLLENYLETNIDNLDDDEEEEDEDDHLFHRYKRDISIGNNRVKTVFTPQYERVDFPWQLEYQKVLKRPGNQHPMLRPKTLIALSVPPVSNAENSEGNSVTKNGKQLLNEIEFKLNELRKKLETLQNDSVANLSVSRSANKIPKINANLTEAAANFKEKLAKIRENIKQKLQNKRKSNFNEILTGKKENATQRVKRDTILQADTPFFRIKDLKSMTKKRKIADDSEEDFNVQQNKEEILGKSLMKPFNAEHIVPHDPIFYLLNFPIRCLDHLNRLKKQISPVLHAFPLMLQKSRKYFKDMSKDAKNDVVNFGSHVVGSFTRLSPAKNPWDALTPNDKRTKRELNSQIVDLILGKSLSDKQERKEEEEEDGRNKSEFERTFWIPTKNEEVRNNSVQADYKDGKYESLYELVHKNYDPYEDQSGELLTSNEAFVSSMISSQDNDKGGEDLSRRKRAIFKLVDEEEIEDYLKEKFSSFDDFSSFTDAHHDHEDSEAPVLKSSQYTAETDESKIVLEKVIPKIIIDDNGRPFAEINGLKRPLFGNIRKSPIVGGPKKDESKTKMTSLASTIEKAKRYSFDGRAGSQSYSSDENMHAQAIKNRLSQILDYIESLLHWDFEEDVHIYVDLLELQNRKDAIVRNWKMLLVQNKHNKINEKIVLLKSLKKIQELKDTSTIHIVEKLHSGHSFNTKNLIKFLVILQKLHCLIAKVAEEFSDNLHIGKFDVEREIEFVDYLQAIEFFECQNQEEIRGKLHRERDVELERELALLEDLKQCLTLAQGDKKYDSLIFEEARLLWEFKNIEGLQKDSLTEMNKKLKSGLKIRKELKILFDLQKQYDNCEENHSELIQKILKEGGKKSRRYRYQDDHAEDYNIVGSTRFGVKKPKPIAKLLKKNPIILKSKQNLMLGSESRSGPQKKSLAFWSTFR